MIQKYLDNDFREKLKNIRAFVIDLDGTTYLENEPFSWTIPFLEGLKKHNIKFVFLSNNSSKSREQHRQKLESIGIDVGTDEILSSADATIEYLKTRGDSKNIFLLATPGVEDDFKKAGFTTDSHKPNYMVLAYDLTLTFDKLDKACRFVRNGVPFIATHEDNNWMIGPNDFRPDVGALAAAITASTKIQPKFIGKPNAEMVDAFLKRLNVSKDQVAIIGDRMNADIRMGQDHHILSILVLSGKTKREDIKDSPFQPGFVVERTVDIIDYLS